MGRWTQWEGAEKLFLDEQRDKHQQRQNLRAKSGRGGSRAGTKKSIMPFESMSKAEQKKYTAAGEMRVYKMMITVEQFKELDKEKRTEYLHELIKSKSKNEIAKEWGSVAYHYLEQAGLHTPQKLGTPRISKKKRTAALLEQEREQVAAEKERFEAEVKDAIEAAREAQRAAKSMRNDLDVSKQSFIQSLAAFKKEVEQQFITQQEEMTKIIGDQNLKLSIVSKVVEEQEKEIATLREDAAAYRETIQNLIDQIDKMSAASAQTNENLEAFAVQTTDSFVDIDNKIRQLNANNHKNESHAILSHGMIPNNNNEILSRVKTIEIDVTLLKQLAIK